MKPSLQLRIGQQLTLTPQLKQAIRLLTLSTVELQSELSLAVESNPMLEWAEADAEGDTPVAAEAASAVAEPVAGSERAVADSKEQDQQSSSNEDEWREVMELALDRGDGEGRRGGSESEDEGAESRYAEVPSLVDHLLWQLHLSHLSERDLLIAIAIVESLDEDGYLAETDDAIATALAPEVRVGADEVAAMRHFVQQLDPVGVASRDLRECLLVQLQQHADDPAHAAAHRLVDRHLEQLARLDRARLARELEVDEAAIDASMALIRGLVPKPGAAFSSSAAEPVVPDVHVFKVQGRWEVMLSSGSSSKLRINDHYASLLRHCGRDEGGALKGQLQEARWLLKSLEQRDQTVLKVAQVIVERQGEFFEHGPERMRPMVLREVAEAIGMHESTISRVTTRKYMHTPRGTLEFKYFFSSHVATRDGGEASSTAIQAMIRKLVEEEDPRKPLSDSALADTLKRRGILVARRTVAKYREALRIPSSNDRVRG